MKAVFIETHGFTRRLGDLLSDESYAKLQQELMDNPERGAVIPGCGGLRKVRVADPFRGKGRRGGIRIVYLYVPEASWFFMVHIYGKDETEDLTPAKKKLLSKLVDQLKQQAADAVDSWKRNGR